MSAINVLRVDVLDNPSPFLNPLQFEVSFECVTPLAEDLEWSLIYVGSPRSQEYDQVLDSIVIGPVGYGTYRFLFQANPPDASRIPHEDLLGVTAILLCGQYRSREFIRVGYFVNNEYEDEELKENPPRVHQLDKVRRTIADAEPRVSNFHIYWDEATDGEIEFEEKRAELKRLADQSRLESTRQPYNAMADVESESIGSDDEDDDEDDELELGEEEEEGDSDEMDFS